MNEWEWRLLEERPLVQRVPSAGRDLYAGMHVRLRPRPGGDIMDIALAGQTAVIESIEQDYEGGYHLAVVLDRDPGRDLGLMRQPGHRFFYGPDEVEPVTPELRGDGAVERVDVGRVDSLADAPILIAGIGNIFQGDDGFGVAVAQRLFARELPVGVRVVVFGIRSFDLAYALADAAGVTILIDACARGNAPGTLYLIDPQLENDDTATPAAIDAHSMNPMLVIQMARSMASSAGTTGIQKPILVLGCEPETLGPEEGQLGLSRSVAAAVDEAVTLALVTVRRIRAGDWPGDDRGRSA